MIPNRFNSNLSQVDPPQIRQVESSRVSADNSFSDGPNRQRNTQTGNDLQTYLDLAGVIFVEIGHDQQVKRINKRGCEILGYPEHLIIGKNWFDCFIPNDRKEKTLSHFLELISDGNQPNNTIEDVVFTEAGEERIIEWHNTVLKDDDGRILGTLSSGQDITERKKYEDALQWELCVNSSLARLSNALISTPDDLKNFAAMVLKAGLALTDSLHGYVSMIDSKTGHNQALSFTNIKDPSNAQQDHHLVFAKGSDDCYDDVWGHSINTQAAFRSNAPLLDLGKAQSPDGFIPLQCVVSIPVMLAGSVVGQLTMLNAPNGYRQRHVHALEQIGELYALAIQHQKSEEEKTVLFSRLQQAQKMESIGTLAGGIAHDFNNILFPIIGYTEMAIGDAPDDGPLLRYLEETLMAANRAKELVQQILTFSRQSHQDQMPLRVQSIIKEVSKLLRSSLPATIEIQLTGDNDCGQVLADPSQIHQIIMNLATNAYHAMRENGGVLSIKLCELEIKDGDYHQFPEVNPGLFVELTVSDTGHGMDRSVIDRIYDPYFTTKKSGEGSGLGLSVVHGIVKDCNGYIAVDSEPGRGSTFRVYLPKIAADEPVERKACIKDLPMGSETVLLVDDEDQIVNLEKQILERLGYQVVACTSSLDAFAAFQKSPKAFDLVITDQTMPKLTGMELANKILKIRPDTPIILSTGFTEISTEQKAKLEGISEFVRKPVVMADLARAIRKVLKH